MVLYGIGKKGGKKALSRFSPERVAWIEAKMQEYGSWAVFAAVMAPPPFPTKPVILAAGVLQTLNCGSLRVYLPAGWCAIRSWDIWEQNSATILHSIIKAHYPEIFLILLGVIALVVLIRYLRNRRSRGV